MSILTNIVAAEDDEIEAVGEAEHPIEEWSGIEMRGVDTAKIVALHALLTGDLLDDAWASYEPAYVSGAEGAIVLRLADELAEKLLALEEDAIADVGAELAATEAFETEGWDTEEITGMVDELANLARLADSQCQVLLVWMHPLRT